MKSIIAAAAIFLVATSAQAQQWQYSHGPGGTPPFAYNGDQIYTPSYSPPPVYRIPDLPSVPQIGGYVPQRPVGPTGYPCTLPVGCH